MENFEVEKVELSLVVNGRFMKIFFPSIDKDLIIAKAKDVNQDPVGYQMEIAPQYGHTSQVFRMKELLHIRKHISRSDIDKNLDLIQKKAREDKLKFMISYPKDWVY